MSRHILRILFVFSVCAAFFVSASSVALASNASITAKTVVETAKVDPLKCKPWNVVSSPDASSENNALTSVTAISPNDVWAAGNTTINGVDQTLIEQWNGTSWNIVPSPSVGSGNNFLSGVAAVTSSKTVWAVGFDTNGSGVYQTLIEQWKGPSWNVVTSPNAGSGQNSLNGVVAISAKTTWAVGQYANNNGIAQTLIEQWRGKSWNIVTSPNGNNLLAVAGVPHSKKLWSVGYSTSDGGSLQTLTESYC